MKLAIKQQLHQEFSKSNVTSLNGLCYSTSSLKQTLKHVLSNYLENDLLIFCWFVIYKTKTWTWTAADLIALKCK